MSKNQKKGVLILVLGIVILLVSLFVPWRNGNLKDDNRLERKEYGEGEAEVTLVAISKQGETTIDFNIAERKFTENELEEMVPDFLESLVVEVIGENPSQDHIYQNLNFVEEIEGYPFSVSWSTDRSDLVGLKGNLKEEITVETPVLLTAELEYEEWSYIHSFPVILVSRDYTPAEEWRRTIEDALAGVDVASSHQTFLKLPDKVNGVTVEWGEKTENKGMQIGVFCLVIAVLLFLGDSVEKKEQTKKRIAEIRKTYPEFVLKCAMLIGAGMTIRQTFMRLGKAYYNNTASTNMLYEEVLVGLRELENGVAERQVYENFGRRCGIREVEKLGNMLSRNLRKGSDGLKSALREEAKEAMEMQKEQVRKQGETAGTKLLFPMLIFLLIVMVIIMIPAFSTFSI